MQHGREGALPHFLRPGSRAMSSSASRAWMTSGSPVSRAAAIWARKPRCLRVARAVVVVIVEPGLADRRPLSDAGERATSSVVPISGSSCASCGCVPTVQKTSSKRSAMRDQLARAAHPRADRDHAPDARAARARPRRRGRSAKSGKSRWQWLSIKHGIRPLARALLPARHSAGKTGAGARQRRRPHR